MNSIEVPDWVVARARAAVREFWENYKGGVDCGEYDAAMSAALTAALGAWVVPKPLEWRELSGGQQVAVTPWRSDYWITFPVLGYGAGKVQASFLDAREPWAELFDSVEEAKSAVFTHHAKKIAALTALRQEKPE